MRRVRRLWLIGVLAACSGSAVHRGATVLYASGADLQSANPLLTVHPLARQVQKFVLLTTLARYDASLHARPYLARRWEWSADRRTLTCHLVQGLHWHDGWPTTARDVVWTLEAARDTVTGYPRWADLTEIRAVRAPDDSTVAIEFRSATGGDETFPDVLTDLAILPAHLLDSIPHEGLRRAGWNDAPVGNGPFRFVSHEPHRRWVFERNPDFPASLGGPPLLQRFIVVVVDEPTTKLAALTAGELDFAGISAAHGEFVRRDPALAVVSYPLLLPYGIVFNTRRHPFDDLDVRRAVALAINRQEIIDGFLFGFGTVADGPVPPDVRGALTVTPIPFAPDSARALLRGRRVPFELLTVGSGEAALEQMVQARLAAVGFDVTIRQLELTAFLDRVHGPRHDFDAAVMGVSGDLGLGYLAPLARDAGLDVPADPVAAQRVFAATLPVAWLYHARGVQGMNRRVHGVTMDVRGELVTVSRWRVP